MKRFLFTSFLLLLTSVVVRGQQLSEADLVALDQKIVGTRVSFKQVSDNIVVSYSLLAPEANVDLYVSLDAGMTWYGPLQKVSGDAGAVRGKGRKMIVWNALDEFGELESSSVAFYVLGRAEQKEIKPVPKRNLPKYQVTLEGVLSPAFSFSGIAVHFGMNKIGKLPIGMEAGIAYSVGGNPSSFGGTAALLYGVTDWLYLKAGAVYNRFSYKDPGLEKPWVTNAFMGETGANFIIADSFVISAGVWISSAIKGYQAQETSASGVSYYVPVPSTYYPAGVWPHLGIGLAF